MTRSLEEEKALHHLGYEWWMFRSTHEIVAKLERDDDPVRNALVESLVIHGRNLIDFFYIPAKGKDDLVSDGVRCKQQPLSSIPAALKEWRDQSHKRVAHLTGTRFADYDTWKADEVRSELAKRIDEVKAAMGADMPEGWKGDTGTVTRYKLRAERPSAGAVGSPSSGTGMGGAVGATGAGPLTTGDVPGTTTSRMVVLEPGRK